MIQIQKPSLGSEELEEVKKVFDTGWLGMGSKVIEFEGMVKEYLGAGHVIAVNTGTTALHIALDACGIGPGDEVITPSLTFCAAVQDITSLGAVPVFCDVDEKTLNLDVDDVARRITSRTRAVMPVHYCGYPCDMEGLLEIRKRQGLRIIEDAAHAFGSSFKGKKIGGFGDITCFSFDPIKNITCGEGGAIALGDDEIAELMRRKRTLGITRDSWQRWKGGPAPAWFYEVVTQGYRYHMSNINAAIGVIQLRRLNGFIERKRAIVKEYNAAFEGIPSLEILTWDNLDEMAPFMYVVRIKKDKRDELIDFLAGRDIGSGVHYIPNHLQPFFKKYETELPVTERVWQEMITLPLYYDMTDGDVEQVVAAVREFFR